MHSFNEYREIINTHLTDLIADPGEEASELADRQEAQTGAFACFV